MCGADVGLSEFLNKRCASFMQVRHPYVEWDYETIVGLTSSSFLLRTRGAMELELKGQFIETELAGGPCLLFMGSVRLSCLEEMKVGWQIICTFQSLESSLPAAFDTIGRDSHTPSHSSTLPHTPPHSSTLLHTPNTPLPTCVCRGRTCSSRTSPRTTWRATLYCWRSS